MRGLRVLSRLPQNFFFRLGADLALTIQAHISTTENFRHGTPPLYFESHVTTVHPKNH
jgi:hypothetical protein